nr:CvpA family protein [Desulfobacterales bacterium]
MNVLDITIVAVVGYCFLRGIFRGIVREIASIIAVFVGLYGAYIYYPLLAHGLSEWIGNKSYANIISFLLIFFFIIVFIAFMARLIKYIFKASFLGWLDHLFGGVFGMIKGILIVSVLTITLTTFLPGQASSIKKSFLSSYVIAISEKIAALVPKEMKQKFYKNIKEFKKDWRKL